MITPYPQHHKKAQAKVNTCNAGLEKITGKEPIKVQECEGVMGVVAESREIE